jgi:hypothetical protein
VAHLGGREAGRDECFAQPLLEVVREDHGSGSGGVVEANESPDAEGNRSEGNDEVKPVVELAKDFAEHGRAEHREDDRGEE